jgi:hypothetical protein
VDEYEIREITGGREELMRAMNHEANKGNEIISILLLSQCEEMPIPGRFWIIVRKKRPPLEEIEAFGHA